MLHFRMNEVRRQKNKEIHILRSEDVLYCCIDETSVKRTCQFYKKLRRQMCT